MKKPYIVCHMMTSLDSRIDCAMTAQLPGVDDYYRTLDALNVPTTVSGRVTAQLEMALPGEYQASDPTPVDKEAFSKKADAPGYEVVADTHGKLLWPDAGEPEKPLLILTSVEKVSLDLGTDKERPIDTLTAEEAEKYISENHFAKGSMLPKIQAGISFIRQGEGRRTIITDIAHTRDGYLEKTGTILK